MKTSVAPNEQEVFAHLQKAAEIISHYPWAERAWLFGSYARGEQDETSDLDILLQCEPVSYFRLHDLIEELRAAFLIKVDLVTAGGVSRHIQPYIDKDKILFYMKNKALSDKIRLMHMLEATEDALRFLEGKTYETYYADYQLSLATVKLVEIIGEAANAISKETQSRYPQVEWRKTVAMRNIVVHEYFGIDYTIVWQTITQDLPILKEQLTTILTEL